MIPFSSFPPESYAHVFMSVFTDVCVYVFERLFICVHKCACVCMDLYIKRGREEGQMKKAG